MEKTCKIILVDDHSLFRNGLRGLLAAHPGYEVVGEAASGEEFLTMLPALAADVAFMDIAMPGMAGDEATVQALGLQPDLKIITLSMYGEEVYYTRMMTAGAKGFLLKDSDFSEVIEAIDTVSAGGSYICHELLVQLTADCTRRSVRNRCSTAAKSCRRASRRFWSWFAGGCRTRRSPMNSSSRSAR